MPDVLWDGHSHGFRDAAEGRRWQSYSPVSLGEDGCSGDIAELKGLIDAAGITRVVLLLFARPNKRYEELLEQAGGDDRSGELRRAVEAYIVAFNEWGCAVKAADPRFEPFVNVDPNFMDAASMAAHVEAMAAAGARGVKVVPSAMRLYPEDERFEPVYELCARRGLPIVAQSGHGVAPAAGADPFSRPARWAPVLSNFPRLKVTLAHLGHGFEDDVIALARRFEHLYTDTSVRLSGPPLDPGTPYDPAALVAFLREVGVERVLFGTNYPMVSPVDYARALDELPVTDDERALLAHRNFARVIDGAPA